MNTVKNINQDTSVLKWGGWIGILGGVFMIISMIVAMVFVPADPPTYSELVARFPDVLPLRVAENVFYLIGLVSGIPLALSVFWSLRKSSLAPALFGTALVSTGLISMIVMATPHVAHSRISDLYQMSGTTPAAQETLGLMWQATWGITDIPLYVGFFVGTLGFILIGIATFGSPEYGKILRWVCVALGTLGFAAATLQFIFPSADYGAVSFLTYIILYFVLGVKICRLAK